MGQLRVRQYVSLCKHLYSRCQSCVVTRTMPVGNGGKFTPEARAIYELVLEMQAVCFSLF